MRSFTLLCSLLLGWSAAGAELRFNFGDLAVDGGLTNFHAAVFGEGGPAAWKILPGEAPSAFAPVTPGAKGAAGGSVLAQTSQNPADRRFPMFIYDGEKFRDFRFATQFKIVSGVIEQMAGVVLRYQNVSNFYVVRVNALGRNLRFYSVVNGVLSKPIGPDCAIAAGEWHELAVQCEGTHITVWLDGQPAMPTLANGTFAEGKIGFWTKSDAVSYFANARVDYTPIVPAAQVLINQTLAQEPHILNLQIYTLCGTNATRILASKDPAERGQPGTDAELAAIQSGTVSMGRDHHDVLVTMPLHDRNGDYIAAVRVKLRSFFGETDKNAVMRAKIILNLMEEFGTSAEDLLK